MEEHRIERNWKLRQARKAQRWTIAEASERVGVDVRTYSRWEQGNITPRLNSLKRLCDVFALPAEALGYPLF